MCIKHEATPKREKGEVLCGIFIHIKINGSVLCPMAGAQAPENSSSGTCGRCRYTTPSRQKSRRHAVPEGVADMQTETEHNKNNMLLNLGDAIAFGKQKVAEASEAVEDHLAGNSIPDPVREEEEDIPIVIHGDGGASITISISQYYRIGDQIQAQIMQRNTAELCFTNIALAGQVASEEGFDRSEPVGASPSAAGVRTVQDEQEQEQDSPVMDEPYEEPLYEEDYSQTGPEADESVPEAGIPEAEGPRVPSGQKGKEDAPRRTPKDASRQGRKTPRRTNSRNAAIRNKLAAGKEGQKYKVTLTDKNGNRVTKIVTMTRRTKDRTQGKEAEKTSLGTAAVKKTRPAEKSAVPVAGAGIARKTLDEAEILAGKRQEAFEIMAQAAAVTDMSGRNTSFENRDGQRLVIRREFDREAGAEIPKAYVDGKEVDAAGAADFVMGVMAASHPKVAQNIKYIVTSAVKNPEINREFLEKEAARNMDRQQSTSKNNPGR